LVISEGIGHADMKPITNGDVQIETGSRGKTAQPCPANCFPIVTPAAAAASAEENQPKTI
jgi:hypothetical protein